MRSCFFLLSTELSTLSHMHTYRPTESLASTGYMGSIEATYADLLTAFGEPNFHSWNGKSDAVWGMVFEDSTRVSVHNWKDGKAYLGDKGKPVTEITHWCVGGTRLIAVQLVAEVLGLTVESVGSDGFPYFKKAKDKA